LRQLADGRWLARPAFEALALQLLEAGRRYQAGSTYRWGQARGELKRALPREAEAALFDALVDGLLRDGRLFRRGERYRVDSPEQPLKPAEADLLARVEAAFAAGGFSPPTVKELEEALRAGRALAEILASLVSEGRLVRVTSDLYYPTATMEGMEATVRAFFKDHNEMRIGDLKELFGQSRKHAVPALEHFDRIGLTRRLGDIRVAGRSLSPE
jgi:selenocysteine-specific elongation factor